MSQERARAKCAVVLDFEFLRPFKVYSKPEEGKFDLDDIHRLNQFVDDWDDVVKTLNGFATKHDLKLTITPMKQLWEQDSFLFVLFSEGPKLLDNPRRKQKQ
jgi:hypothetical protein